LEFSSRTDLSQDLTERQLSSSIKLAKSIDPIILPSTDNKKRSPKNLLLSSASSWKNSLNGTDYLQKIGDHNTSTSLTNLLTPRSSARQVNFEKLFYPEEMR
jgi:hypothetical protein